MEEIKYLQPLSNEEVFSEIRNAQSRINTLRSAINQEKRVQTRIEINNHKPLILKSNPNIVRNQDLPVNESDAVLKAYHEFYIARRKKDLEYVLMILEKIRKK